MILCQNIQNELKQNWARKIIWLNKIMHVSTYYG